MALDAQSVVGLVTVGVTVVGSVGAYIVSVEKRLNGRKSMQDSLDRIERKVDAMGTRAHQIEITVARLDQRMKDQEA